MTAELFIVARDRPDLYRYFAQTFADADSVRVIWDRRLTERRRSVSRVDIERRRADRRSRRAVDEELRTAGYAFISIGGSSSPISR